MPLEAAGPTPGPVRERPPTRRRPVTRAMTRVSALLRRDLAVVTMMAIAMTLSAFSVYQATRAADDAQARFAQARFVEAEVTRASGSLETLVANDSAVMAQLCATTLDGELALAQLLSPTDPHAERLVAANIELDILRPLVRGDRDAHCDQTLGVTSAYRVDVALAGLESDVGIAGLTTRAMQLRAEAGDLHARERVLIVLGLAFIAVLATLIVVDQLVDRTGRPRRVHGSAVQRWRAGLVVGCVIVVVAGTAILIAAAVDTLAAVLVVATLILAATGIWLWVRVRGAGSRRGADRPRWWAEVLGAATLVAFAGAAVALSAVSISEREASARSDVLMAAAERSQQHGLEVAARGLAALTSYADAEAAAVETMQVSESFDGGEDVAAAAIARRTEIDRRLTVVEDGLRQGLDAHLDTVEASACSASPPTELAIPTAPSQLYDELADSAYLAYFVAKTQWQTRACDAAAALTRQEVGVWGEHKSTLTVALVVLGLSGFMLGLASGKSRTRRASIILLVVGAAGALVGTALTAGTLPDALWRTSLPTPAQVRELATTTATAQTDCTLDPAPLEHAVAAYDRFGTAHEALGYARWCRGSTTDGWRVLGTEVEADALKAAVGALLRAEELGPVTPTLEGNLGFGLTQLGIVTGDESSVRAGLERTERALAAVARRDEAGSRMPHTLRLNRALTLAALGDHRGALEGYTQARALLRGQPAGEASAVGVTVEGSQHAQASADTAILDEDAVAEIVAWALADLELLDGVIDSRRLDEYRLRLVDADGRLTDAEGVRVPGVERTQLDVFPQELQLQAWDADDVSIAGDAAVVWYHRATSTQPWAVLDVPTDATLRPGAHLGRPLPIEMLLPSGEYRADLYAGGRRVEVHAEGGFAAAPDTVRLESRRMGVSAVVPAAWETYWDDGLDWHVGPTDDAGLWVRRMEYVVADWDVPAYLESELAGFIERFVGEGSVDGPDLETWFVGLSPVIVREFALPDGSIVRAAAGVSSYGADVGCGATLVMAAIGGPGVTQEQRELLPELVATRSTPRVPPIVDRVDRDTFALTVPSGWDGVVAPSGSTGDLIEAKDCRTAAANILLGQEPITTSLAGYVDDAISVYGDPVAFPGFRLTERSQIGVPGAQEAEQIRYTWNPDDGDEVTQVQVYARTETTLTYLTITVWTGYITDTEKIISDIVASLEVR